jgi:23S rRNA (adenine2503-C2)-methyltransferase
LASPIFFVYNDGMTAEPVPILDVPRPELLAWLEKHGQPRMRTRQIHRWLIAGRAESFEQMTDLPRALREDLAAHFLPLGSRIDQHQVARDETHKLLLRLGDGQAVECVLIQEANRHTACISTQVGCGMGCVFCASGLNGLARNLTVGEIIEQLVRLRNLLPLTPNPSPPRGEGSKRPPPLPLGERGRGEGRLTHIVVMGMGEPLANLDNLLMALEMACAPESGMNIGARHVTISTVGLPARIRQLADQGKQFHLAVSLHAPDDELRTRIVPTNPKTGLSEILAAADYFFERTGRQVTFEYVLLRDINDKVEQARQLAGLLRGRQAHVNLIPFNEVEGLPYRPPAQESVGAFAEVLRHSGMSVKVRKRKGSQIDAACGQLRRRVEHPAQRSQAGV